VFNELEVTGRPQPGEQSVEVRARSSFGDITIHHSVASTPAAGAA
jgi:hypothetical protein